VDRLIVSYKSLAIQRNLRVISIGKGGAVKVITESVVEDASLAWLASLGYVVLHGPDIAAGMAGAEKNGVRLGLLHYCSRAQPSAVC
jgi:hypothetical protein